MGIFLFFGGGGEGDGGEKIERSISSAGEERVPSLFGIVVSKYIVRLVSMPAGGSILKILSVIFQAGRM